MPSGITTALTSVLATATMMKVAVTITARGVAYRNWLAQEPAARSRRPQLHDRARTGWSGTGVAIGARVGGRGGSAQESAPVLG
jgi:hypothetical protein